MKNIDTILVFDKVSAVYKSGVGIFDVSFSLDSGDFLFLMGPTGSGKSTILRSIYLDVNIKSGRILYKNQDLSKIKKFVNNPKFVKHPQFSTSNPKLDQTFKICSQIQNLFNSYSNIYFHF